ncbi:MAG TPA: hypothetical protein VLM79_20600 [Kofleriaceae bacterium]|nr:hypothetical protein [Kofleriaceae bacterium]
MTAGSRAGLAVGDGRIVSSGNDGPPQAHWFERSPDGAFRRRASLAGDPQSRVTTVAVSGNHALLGLQRRDGTVVAQSYELDHGDWNAHELLTAPAPSDGQLAHSIALSGDTALVAPYSVASGAPVAFIYSWSAGSWTQSSQLTWSGSRCPIVEVYLDGATAIVQCHDDARTVAMYRRDETGWQPAATPKLPDSITSTPSWLISGDRIVMSGGATTNGQTVFASHVFRWTGDAWSLEHTVLSKSLADCREGCTRGIVALDGDRCVVVTGPTSATAERFVDGAWRADRELALPPAMRSAAASISAAGIAGDQVILAVPGEEIAGRLASGALYVYTWPR